MIQLLLNTSTLYVTLYVCLHVNDCIVILFFVVPLFIAHPKIKGHKQTILHYLVKFDPKASWEKFADALTAIGHNMIGANTRSQFMRISQTVNVKHVQSNKACCCIGDDRQECNC